MSQELVNTVQELISENGRLVTLQTLARTAADAARPWLGPAAPGVATSLAVMAVFVPASGASLGYNLVSDELLKKCEQVCLIAPHDENPDLLDFEVLVDDSQKYTINWAQALKPGSTTYLYAMGVSR